MGNDGTVHITTIEELVQWDAGGVHLKWCLNWNRAKSDMNINERIAQVKRIGAYIEAIHCSCIAYMDSCYCVAQFIQEAVIEKLVCENAVMMWLNQTRSDI